MTDPHIGTAKRRLRSASLPCYRRCMALSDRQLLDALSGLPFVDSAELADILGEPHSTVHRGLIGLLTDGIVGRVSHGTARSPDLNHLSTFAHIEFENGARVV